MGKYLNSAFVLAAIATVSSLAFAQQVGAQPDAQNGVVYPGQPKQSTPPPSGPSQKIDLSLAPAAPKLPPLPGEISPAAQAVDDMVPKDLPAKLMELRQRVDQVLKMGSVPVSDAPIAKMKSSSVTLTQQPGEEPPSVRVAVGTPTNIIFTDATGAPWPIEFVTPGSQGQFQALLPVAGTPTLQIRPNGPYAFGGVSVTLVGNPIPISITVTAAQKVVDTRLDVRVLKRGPNAKAPINDGIGSGGPGGNSTLIAFLDGVPPQDARPLKTTSANVSAWLYMGMMYVRSRIPVVSPGPISANQSVDGTYAYEFVPVPFVNVTADGVISSVSVAE